MRDEGVSDLARPQSSILGMMERMKQEQKPVEKAGIGEGQDAEKKPQTPDQLAPLPKAGDPYKAHARMANGPLTTLFFLAKGQLPDGFAYSGLERVRLVESDKPGSGPALLLRFNGSVVNEVMLEGRHLLALCDQIGRHLIHWVREHPTGREDGDSEAVFIRRIAVREIEPQR